MKAGFGLSIAAGVAALTAGGAAAQTAGAPATAPSPAPAQQQPPPAGDTVGPRELRDFSIGGTPTRPATPPAQDAPPAAVPPPTASSPSTAPARNDRPPQPRARSAAPPAAEPAPRAPASAAPSLDPATPSTPDFETPASPLNDATISQAVPIAPVPAPEVESNSLLLWPWLLAGLAVALGAGLMFLRQRSRAELAGYGADESFAPVQPPSPTPEPLGRTVPVEPSDRPAQSPRSGGAGGIVSTRLRPSLELEFTPGRCILDATQATVEFLIKVTNSGNAHAREVRIDTMLFNAGPTQDTEIGAFFAHPPGQGEALDALPPLKGLELRGSVSLPLNRLQILEVAGRRLFVPLIGFNAVYRWSGGMGQTSLSFLLGREGEGEKMAPFRADLGPRVFRGLGARQLQIGVHR